MLQDDHVVCDPGLYRDQSDAFMKLVEFLRRFVVANQEVIRDHQEKLKKGKRTRRVVPNKLFIEVT